MLIPKLAAVSALLALTTSARSQSAATYELYGGGCNGQPLGVAVALNGARVALPPTTASQTYAYPVVNSTGGPLAIAAVELFTVNYFQSTECVGVVVVNDLAGPGAVTHTSPGSGVARFGGLTVGPVPQWRRAYFPQPPVIQAGAAFWIVHEAYRGNSASIDTLGVPGVAPIYVRSGGMPWAPAAGLSGAPALRVLARAMGPATPSLTATGRPVLGAPFSVNLQNGTPGGMALLLWSARPSAVKRELGAFGAPSCLLFWDADEFVALPVDGAGRATWTVPIPSAPSLVGLSVSNQFASIAPGANALGVTFSNGGYGVLGR